MPLAHVYAIAQALEQASLFSKRIYAAHHQDPSHFAPLEDFFFSGADECPWLITVHRRKSSTAIWAQMLISDEGSQQGPTVSVSGHTERIDALAVMLSYLALRHETPLSYQLPILKQVLTASADGVLTLND